MILFTKMMAIQFLIDKISKENIEDTNIIDKITLKEIISKLEPRDG